MPNPYSATESFLGLQGCVASSGKSGEGCWWHHVWGAALLSPLRGVWRASVPHALCPQHLEFV